MSYSRSFRLERVSPGNMRPTDRTDEGYVFPERSGSSVEEIDALFQVWVFLNIRCWPI